MILTYDTRDGEGNDIRKEVTTKEVPAEPAEYICPCCGLPQTNGIPMKKLVSSNFTDWNVTGDYICPDCLPLVSLYPYSYVKDPDGIRLLNVRQLKAELTRKQKPPFLFVISTSQKKHLWFRSKWNYTPDCYPDIYQRLCEAWPEVSAFA